MSTHVDVKLREKRICEIITSTILKNSLQIEGNETYISNSERSQYENGQFVEIRS